MSVFIVAHAQSPFDRFITKNTWIAIGILVAIEIFINTPIFQTVKPFLLNLFPSE